MLACMLALRRALAETFLGQLQVEVAMGHRGARQRTRWYPLPLEHCRLLACVRNETNRELLGLQRHTPCARVCLEARLLVHELLHLRRLVALRREARGA